MSYHILGATHKKSRQSSARARGRSATSGGRTSPHKRGLARAERAVKRALAAATLTSHRAATYSAAAHKPIVPLAHAKPSIVGGVAGYDWDSRSIGTRDSAWGTSPDIKDSSWGGKRDNPSIGADDYDIAAAVASGGMSLVPGPIKWGWEWVRGPGPAGSMGQKNPYNYLASDAYQAAQGRYAAAKARAAAAAGRTAPAAPASVIPVSVPSFMLGAMHEEIIGADEVVVFGAARPLTSVQQKAVKKHTEAIAKHAAAVIAAKSRAKKAAEVAKKVAGEVRAAKKKFETIWKKAKMPTHVRPHVGGGDVVGSGGRIWGGETVGIAEVLAYAQETGSDPADVISAFEEAGCVIVGTVGEGLPWDYERRGGMHLVGDAAADLEAASDTPSPDPVEDVDIVGEDTPDDSANTGAQFEDEGDVPPPTRDQALSADAANVTWHKVPDDGVRYDGSKGFPSGSIGSYRVFYGDGTGAFYGSSETGVDTHWYVIHNDLGWYLRKVSGGKVEWDDPSGWEKASAAYIAANAQQFGPLVGDPKRALAGLQYAVDEDQWFWQSDQAPTWATAEADHALALLNQKAREADQAARDAEQARLQQEQAQREENQAKQDAANALAQSAADTQSAIAEQARASQQAQLDVQQQQAEQQYAAEQAKIDVEAQRAQLDYLRSHPEAMAEAMRQQGEGQGDEGVPEEQYPEPPDEEPIVGTRDSAWGTSPDIKDSSWGGKRDNPSVGTRDSAWGTSPDDRDSAWGGRRDVLDRV